MTEVHLTLHASNGEETHKTCVITHLTLSKIQLTALNDNSEFNIKDFKIEKINNETLEITTDETQEKYIIQFQSHYTMDNIMNKISVINNYVDADYIHKEFIEGNNNLKFQNKIIEYKIIEKKILESDFEYLEILLKYGNYNIIMEFLKNIKALLKIYNLDKNMPEHQLFMILYNEIIIKLFNGDRKEYILSIIELAIENNYDTFKFIDIIHNITNTTDAFKYLNYCKKTRKLLSSELIFHFLSSKPLEEFSTMLLFISEFSVQELRIFIGENIQLLIDAFLKQNDDCNVVIIHSLYFATTHIFNTNCSHELLTLFYRNIHKVFLRGDVEIYNPRRKLSHFRDLHYRFLDLLLFMERNHDYMFCEFFISTGLLTYFKNARESNKEISFFWCRLSRAVKYHDNMLKEYIDM